MKNTGITRPVDSLNRVCLPMELRKTMDYEEKQSVTISVEDDFITLVKTNGPGIARSIDSLGRIVMPMEICKTKDIQEEDLMEIYVSGDAILLKQFKADVCHHCGSLIRKGK